MACSRENFTFTLHISSKILTDHAVVINMTLGTWLTSPQYPLVYYNLCGAFQNEKYTECGSFWECNYVYIRAEQHALSGAAIYRSAMNVYWQRWAMEHQLKHTFNCWFLLSSCAPICNYY
jgi:hypothetical protein